MSFPSAAADGKTGANFNRMGEQPWSANGSPARSPEAITILNLVALNLTSIRRKHDVERRHSQSAIAQIRIALVGDAILFAFRILGELDAVVVG
jgi:hypothetical protein